MDFLERKKVFIIGFYGFFITNILDYISTIISLNYGNTEMNYFYKYFNMNLPIFGVFKLILCFLFMFLFYRLNKLPIYEVFIPYYLIFVDIYFIYLVVHNLSISLFCNI